MPSKPIGHVQAADASTLPQLLAARDTTADEDGDHGHLGLDTYQLEDAEWLQAAGRNLQSMLPQASCTHVATVLSSNFN